MNPVPKTVNLQCSDRLDWKVGVANMEEGVVFCGGWEEFVDYYSIHKNDILIFTYDCNHRFTVTIFEELTGCERDVEYSDPYVTPEASPMKDTPHTVKSSKLASLNFIYFLVFLLQSLYTTYIACKSLPRIKIIVSCTVHIIHNGTININKHVYQFVKCVIV